MTDIITDAVRAGCDSGRIDPIEDVPCRWPDCRCEQGFELAETARHAASAMRERAAQVAAHGMKWAEPEQVAAAIRAIPTEGEPKS